MNEKEKIAIEIEKVINKTADAYTVDSWGLHDICWYNDVPVLGLCWSAMCNGLMYNGRILVAKGSKPGTLSIAKREAFGQIHEPKALAELMMLDLPYKKAVQQLDKWIEHGNLSQSDYKKLAMEKAQKDLRRLGIDCKLVNQGKDKMSIFLTKMNK